MRTAMNCWGQMSVFLFLLSLPSLAPAQTFTFTGSMNVARDSHTATRLDDGRVLIAGGEDSSANPLASAELYDPATGTFSLTGSMSEPRLYHTATLLMDGKVLIAGGLNSSGTLANAEVYDPASGTFSSGGTLMEAREAHTATRLHHSASQFCRRP